MLTIGRWDGNAVKFAPISRIQERMQQTFESAVKPTSQKAGFPVPVCQSDPLYIGVLDRYRCTVDSIFALTPLVG